MVLTHYLVENGKVGIKCPRCHKVNFLPITEEELKAWDPSVQFVQDAFPQLDASQRELLLSGLCNTCWNEIFKEEE